MNGNDGRGVHERGNNELMNINWLNEVNNEEGVQDSGNNEY